MRSQKIIQSGNSLALTLPASLVRSLLLRPGDLVQVSVSSDHSEVTYRFENPRQLSLPKPKNRLSQLL